MDNFVLNEEFPLSWNLSPIKRLNNIKYYYGPECYSYSLFNYGVIVVTIKRGAHIRHNVSHRKQVQCHWAMLGLIHLQRTVQ